LRREAPILSRAKYNNVYPISSLDISQDLNIFRMKTENFPRKVLVVRKKAVPLHPLSRKMSDCTKKNFQSSERKTSSFGFPSREGSQGRKALKSSLKDLHRQK
jgi:hypothetical protein